jgi:hypothetical protein
MRGPDQLSRNKTLTLWVNYLPPSRNQTGGRHWSSAKKERDNARLALSIALNSSSSALDWLMTMTTAPEPQVQNISETKSQNG